MPRKRRRAKNKPSIPLPKAVLLMPGRGPDGWRISYLDHDGGLYCGAGFGVPGDAPPQEAQAGADAVVRDLVRTCHGVEIELAWEPMDGSDSWLGRVSSLSEPCDS